MTFPCEALRDLSSTSPPNREYQDLPSQTWRNTEIFVLPALVYALPFCKTLSLLVSNRSIRDVILEAEKLRQKLSCQLLLPESRVPLEMPLRSPAAPSFSHARIRYPPRWGREEQWHLQLNQVLKFSSAARADEPKTGYFLAFQNIARLPITSKVSQGAEKVFEGCFSSCGLTCLGSRWIVEGVCSVGVSGGLKERGARSERQRAKIFCARFSLRRTLQIAFPQWREIISVTLVTGESSPPSERLFSLM